MRTKSAAESAFTEAKSWAEISAWWTADRCPEVWAATPGRERAVIPQVDPRTDLGRRARRWSYPLRDTDLAELARFAAALGQTEADAWVSGDRVVATQALEERRFLAADRIVPWAVPWLRAVAESFPDRQQDAAATASVLLEIGERHRPAPVLTGDEGLNPLGHDGYGPAVEPADLADRLNSLWGGLVLLQPRSADALIVRYTTATEEWRNLADRYPGTARYWLDLAERAELTAEIAK